jgi:hypothetical protein
MSPMSVHSTSLNIHLLDIKIQIDLNTVRVGEFNKPLSPIDRSTRKGKKNQQTRIE